MNSSPTLFERIGGMPAVNLAVDIFYERVLADALIAPFFERTAMAAQAAKQKAFLAYAFGAPMAYTGQKMRAAHAHMQLDGTHFDAVAGHLAGTLRELGVAEDLIAEVMVIAGGTRSDVLNEPAESNGAVMPV